MPETNDLSCWLENNIGRDKLYSSNIEVANLIGVSDSTVRRVRNGIIPSLGILRKFAELPGWDLESIQKALGLIEGAEINEVRSPEIERVAERLELLEETPIFYPGIAAVNKMIDALLVRLDPAEQHDQTENDIA